MHERDRYLTHTTFKECKRRGKWPVNLLSASWFVSELTVSKLTCQRVGLSASCLVSELVCQRVGLSASCHVDELVCQRDVCEACQLTARETFTPQMPITGTRDTTFTTLIKCAFARRAAHLVKCADWPKRLTSSTFVYEANTNIGSTYKFS